jgi:hypothetical protein
VKSFAFGAALALLILAACAWRAHLARPTGPVLVPPPPAKVDQPETTDADTGNGPLVALPDLSGVDRSLVQPPGLRNPGYCLLVFGKREVKTRVWLVEDGDTLYVDRDGSGNLTGPAKAIRAVARDGDTPSSPYREWTYPVGDLTPDGGREKHTHMQVIRVQESGEAPKHIVYVRSFGKILQRTGAGSIFSKDRETAPVIHFGGPVVPKALRSAKFTTGGENQELHLCVGTPGRGESSFAYVCYENLPWNIHPVARIRWPQGSPQTEDRFLLKKRC